MLFSKRYLVSDAPAEHHVRVHPLFHVQAGLGQFSPQNAAFDEVRLSDVRHVPQTSAQTQTHTGKHHLVSPVLRFYRRDTNVCVCARSHPLPLDDLDVVFRPGVESFRTQGAPEVAPQLPVFGQHRSYDEPDGEHEDFKIKHSSS